MLNNITFGRYYLKDSIVHKLSPMFKIISLIIMMIAMFYIDSYVDLLMLTSYLLLAIVYSDISIKVYLKNILGLKIFLIFIFVIDLIFTFNINRIIFDLFRIIFIILYASILSYTTSITEIAYGMQKLLKPLNKIIPVSDIAMITALSIRYIPSLTDSAHKIIRSQKLRGINFDSKKWKEKIISTTGVLLPMFAMSIKKSERTADIMDIRLYNYGRSKTNYRTNKWSIRDYLLLVLNILIFIIVIFY